MKNVQRGVASYANSTVTITSVNLAKSFVMANNFGSMHSESGAPYRVSLTSATTLQFSPAGGSTGNANPAWQVVEF